MIELYLLILAGLVVYCIVVFNRLIGARNSCTNARAGIDVNLTRRHQLIPNLVAVVRGYAAHEQETLTAVTRARSQAISVLGSSQSARAEAGLAEALALLNVRLEAYPELKAQRPFINLMKNLTEAEEQISASRRAFNAHVMQMNNLVQQFPTLIIASLFGFKVQEPFSAGAGAQHAPIVNLPG
ncbi:MAG: LemA family protein [Pseudomonadaceae bacterium]|nr:LemA family protein [Pseudomonadaceae bacterium]